MKKINDYSIEELKEIKRIEKRLKKALCDYSLMLKDSLNMKPEEFQKEILDEMGIVNDSEKIIDSVIKDKESDKNE